MEIRYLKEFIVLAEQLNFSKASEELYVSQPVLSKHIASLEKDLGLPLFTRNSRNVTLTDWGNKYLSFAENIVAEYEKSEKYRKRYLKDRKETLLIGLVENPQVFGLDKNLIDFHRLYPGIKIRTHEDTEKNLWKMLDQGSLDLITTAGRPDEFGDDEFIVVYRGRMDACISVNDPLSRSDSILLTDIADHNIYFPPKDGSLSIMLDAVFVDNNIPLNNVNYGNYDAEMRYAEGGLGIAIMPSHIIDDYKIDSVRHIPIEPAIPYVAGVKISRTKPLTDPEKAFLDFTREFAASLMQQK